MSITTKSKLFNSRELIFMTKLSQSRDFQSIILNRKVDNSFVFVVYGSINAVSAKQRNILRCYINSLNSDSSLNLQTSIRSKFVTHNFMNFSSFNYMKNLFKGTVYSLKIEVKTESENVAYLKIKETIDKLKTIKFAETMPFNFMPSIIVLTNTKKEVTPLRFIEQIQVVTN